jgi:hypothetical protein
MAIGSLFLLLNFCEWHVDISEHLFPSGQFKISGADAIARDYSVSAMSSGCDPE